MTVIGIFPAERSKEKRFSRNRTNDSTQDRQVASRMGKYDWIRLEKIGRIYGK